MTLVFYIVLLIIFFFCPLVVIAAGLEKFSPRAARWTRLAHTFKTVIQHFSVHPTVSPDGRSRLWCHLLILVLHFDYGMNRFISLEL